MTICESRSRAIYNYVSFYEIVFSNVQMKMKSPFESFSLLVPFFRRKLKSSTLKAIEEKMWRTVAIIILMPLPFLSNDEQFSFNYDIEVYLYTKIKMYLSDMRNVPSICQSFFFFLSFKICWLLHQCRLDCVVGRLAKIPKWKTTVITVENIQIRWSRRQNARAHQTTEKTKVKNMVENGWLWKEHQKNYDGDGSQRMLNSLSIEKHQRNERKP